jgi:hypothetical protein
LGLWGFPFEVTVSGCRRLSSFCYVFRPPPAQIRPKNDSQNADHVFSIHSIPNRASLGSGPMQPSFSTPEARPMHGGANCLTPRLRGEDHVRFDLPRHGLS